MNFSAVLALIAVSAFPTSHGVLASTDRAARESSTTTATAKTSTIILASTSTTKTMKKTSHHDAAMRTQPGDPIGMDAQKTNAVPARATEADTVTSITKSCKKFIIRKPLGRVASTPEVFGRQYRKSTLCSTTGMGVITRIMYVHVCTVQLHLRFSSPLNYAHTRFFSLLFPDLFPSPRHGEVEDEGMPASAHDVIKGLAYRASQDAGGNADDDFAATFAGDEVQDISQRGYLLFLPFFYIHAFSVLYLCCMNENRTDTCTVWKERSLHPHHLYRHI